MKRKLEYSDIVELVEPNFETGELFWKPRGPKWFEYCTRGGEWESNRWNSRYARQKAGTKKKNGYSQIAIFGRVYLTHRIIWLLANGEWPDQVDHINGNTSDDRLSNLRNVSNWENRKNMKRHKCNTSGFTGVTFSKQRNKWRARIQIDGKEHLIGFYSDIQEAAHARKEAELKYGYHENHGRIV